MSVSAFQKVVNRLFDRFIKQWGREPQTPKEWMDLQNEAVRHFNKTKGVPPGPAKPPFQGWKPEVIQGGKGIESLLESGVVKKGVAPKTTKETLKTKKDRGILLRDSEEGIARIKRENKQAIEDFKKKFHKKKTVEDYRDEGDWDPGGMASGGRIAMAGGGALKKFIEQLFIKASNDIRLGRGKWKGLDQKQRMVQHDNLTKKVVEFQKSGNTEGLEVYFDVNPNEAFAAASKKVKETGPLVSDDVLAKAYDEVFYQKPASGDYKYDADVLADSIAEQLGKGSLDDFSQVQQTEIYNTALKRVTDDLKMKRTLKDVEQKMQLSDFDPKDRLPNQSGGLAYMLGEPTYMKAGGGHVGHGPWTMGQLPQQPQPQPQQAPRHPQQGQPNPMKMPQGIPSAAPRSMDPRVMQQQMMQRAMMGGMGQQRRPGMKKGGATIPMNTLALIDLFMNQGMSHSEAVDAAESHTSIFGKADGGRIPQVPEEFLEDFKRREYHKFLDKYRRFQEDHKRRRDLAPTQEVADGGRIGLMYGGDPGFAFEYGGSWADWHDQHRNAMPVEDYIQTKLPKERLPFRDNYAGGGRIGFGLGSMSRRAFMKMMAGMAALPFVGKGVSKVAPKVIKEAEVITRGADGMPAYVVDLIEVVKAKGTKDFIEGFKKSDYSTVHSYKGVDVIEHPSGATTIKKQHEGGGSYTTDEGIDESFDGITREIEMEITPGQYEQIGNPQFDDAAKAVQGPDEYVEYTARPDMDGKMKDVDEYIDDADHLELKEIADEAKDLLKIKKASGGLAHMLGE